MAYAAHLLHGAFSPQALPQLAVTLSVAALALGLAVVVSRLQR